MRCPSCQAENDNEAQICFHCGAPLAAAVAHIRKGSVIAGRYEIVDTLGKGGMGMVYKAHDRELDETVALKLLRQDIAADPEMQKRFRAEVKLARRVRHRNVCGIHEFGQDGNLRFIAMEFIEGVDMRQILNRKGAPLPEEAFEISIQVGQGLQAIHDVGIVHRDLKTPNIMRDMRGHVRLMDFGIAKQLGAEATLGATQMGMIVGTPEYMSPEQARGEKIDFRSDIYALGVVIFEIFTGHVPFRGETPIATIFKHLQEAPPLEGPGAEALPPALVPVLRRSLAKTAAERYATVAEMVDALQEARMQAFPHARVTPTTPMPMVGGTPTPLPGTAVLPTPMPTRPPAAPHSPTPASQAATAAPRRGPMVATPPPTVQTPATPAPAADPGRATRETRMRDLLSRAEALASEQKLADAEHLLREAVQIEPSHTLAQRLLATVTADLQRTRGDEERRARESEQAREEAARQKAEREARERAERERAEQEKAERAAREKDDREKAERAAREKAEREKAERKAREKAEREAREKAEREARDKAAREKAEREAREKAERAAREKAEREKAERSAREKAERDKAEREAQARAEEARRRPASPPPPPPVVPSATLVTPLPGALHPPPPPARSSPLPLLAGGGLALLLAIGGGVYLLRSAKPAPTPVPAPVESPMVVPIQPSPADVVPAPPAGLGTLVIDAAPWGEVVEIVDAEGRKQQIPDKAFTPLLISLPAGEYRVSVKNPSHPRAVTLSARVEAAGIAPARVTFQTVDPQQYFKETGW